MSAEELQVTHAKAMSVILGVQKLIPIYQRSFVWPSELQREFFTDLVDAAERGENAPEYFIGSMVFRKNDHNQFEVVDGQQRITTILLLVSAVVKLGEELDFNKEFEKAWSKVKFSLETDHPSNNWVGISNLKHADTEISNAYEAITKGTPVEANSESPMIQRLHDAQSDTADFLKVYIQHVPEKEQARKLAEFLHYLTTKVVCIHHVATEMDTALTIFGRLNASGKALTKLEILRGLSFQNAQEGNAWEKIEAEWNTLEPIIQTEVAIGGKGKPRKLVDHDSLLAYKLFVDLPDIGKQFSSKKGKEDNKADNSWVGGDKLARLLLDPIMKRALSNPTEFVNGLTNFAKEVRALRTADQDRIRNVQIRNLLRDIAHIAATQTQWLMLAIPLLRDFGEEVEAFRALRNMVFIYSHVQTGSGTSSAKYKKFSSMLSAAHLGKAPTQEDLDRVVQLMRDEVVALWSEYEAQLRARREPESADKEKIKWALQLVEAELHTMFGVGNYPSMLDFAYKSLNLDHLQPTDLGRLLYDVQHQIGNLSFLTESSNKGLKSGAFESEDKQEALAGTSIWTTKALSKQIGKGKEKKALSYFKSRATMNEADVLDRTDEIIAFLEERLKS
jgi:hypothetical protein